MINFGPFGQAVTAAIGALFFATLSIGAAVGPAAAPQGADVVYAAANSAVVHG